MNDSRWNILHSNEHCNEEKILMLLEKMQKSITIYTPNKLRKVELYELQIMEM